MKCWLVALGLVLVAGVPGCDREPESLEPSERRAPQPIGAGAEIDAANDAGHVLRFRVDAVEKDTTDPDGDVSFYELSVRDDTSGDWVRYCSPDVEGKSRAIPIQGAWDERATYVPGSDAQTTFACTSGAIGKCVRFGYKPWKTVEGRSLLPYHQACVRLVRADYCGDGRPHTKDGTKIDVWDHLGIQRRDSEDPSHREVFEAAWGPGGAVFLAVPRWSDATAEIVAECPDKLRHHGDGANRFEAGAAEAEPEALVFNGRFVNEQDRWVRPRP